jgi:NAD(P)-dependent dehydrogenase (short-subunit alcohol dehydrogenase family)
MQALKVSTCDDLPDFKGLLLTEIGPVHCIDRLATPHPEFLTATATMQQQSRGSMHYHCLDIQDTEAMHDTISGIADQANRLDGLVAAAGIQKVKDAMDYTAADVADVMRINFTGVLMSASMVAREMINRKCNGSMVLVASMSGMVANKSLHCAAYNASKAAVMQLARNLAMEWGPTGIRVNSLCPGHILTPMLRENFEQMPGLREICERENMLGRLATPDEFTGATIFLLSSASSFMTGSQLVIDGGHTAW